MVSAVTEVSGVHAPPADQNAPAILDAAAERAKLVRTVEEWGYFGPAYEAQRPLLEGRHLLEVGMGGGPYSVAAIEVGGCSSYVGVDPKIGTSSVRDLRSNQDPSIPRYRAFPYSPQDIMRLYPNIRLYGDVLENVKSEIRKSKIDMAYMSSVTEHLEHLPEVFKTIWESLEPNGRLWFNHHGYHSWTGHHQNPRSVKEWDPADQEQNSVVDWKHLEPTHPCYADRNLNRVRLMDLRRLVGKYFHIVQWMYTFHGEERLSAALRQRYKKYTLEELLGRTVEVLALRREMPLDTDLSGVPFHHPPESYLEDADYCGSHLSHGYRYGTVFFDKPNLIASHSTNNWGGKRVLENLVEGDRIRLRKHFRVLEFSVSIVRRSPVGDVEVTLQESMPSELFRAAPSDWLIDAVQCWQRLTS